MLILYSITLLILFYILGKSADLVVNSAKLLGKKISGNLLFGLVLGVLTTLPEFFVGINSIVRDSSPLSSGNLIGGLVVVICLVLGLNLFLKKEIKTDGRISRIFPVIFIIFLLPVLGLDGKISLTDGIILLFLYLATFFYILKWEKVNIFHHQPIVANNSTENHIFKKAFFLILGIVLVVISSHWIVSLSLDLSEIIKIPAFLVGLLVFSLGTNLPELVIVLRSIKSGATPFSLNYLIGSSMANVLVAGILAVVSNLNVLVDANYYLMLAVVLISLILFAYFYKTDKKMTRKEGIVFLSLYLAFLIIGVVKFF